MKWHEQRKELVAKREKEMSAMRTLLDRQAEGQLTDEEDSAYATHEDVVKEIQAQIEAGDAQARAAQARHDRMADLERWDAPAPLRIDPSRVMASDGAAMTASADATDDYDDMHGRYLGLDGKDVRRYRIGAYIRGALRGDFRRCGMEMEISDAMRRKYAHLSEQSGLIVPEEILARGFPERRAASTETDHVRQAVDTAIQPDMFQAGSYIEQFWSRMVLQQAMMLNGLIGKQTIPREASRPVAQFRAEGEEAVESTPTWDNIVLEPHRLSIVSGYTGLMQASTPLDLEMIIARQFGMAMSRKLEYAFFHGSSTLHEPTGLLSRSATGAVALFPSMLFVHLGTTNAGGAFTFPKIEEVVTAPQLMDSDVGSWMWIAHPKGASKMRQLYREAGTDTPIWDYRDNQVYGYPGRTTTQISDKLKKGTSGAVNSAAFFLNQTEAILARFVGTAFYVDVSGAAARKDEPQIVMHEYCDVDNRHPESFVAVPDIL